MIDKMNFLKRVFPKLLLKKHKNINKNKEKVFILYGNNKLNWLLFRNMIVVSHYHFQLDPIFFVTDSLGFQDINNIKTVNPYNPTCNIITSTSHDFTEEKIVHTDIDTIKYSVWWNYLDYMNGVNRNLLLFTDNQEELKRICKILNTKNKQIVIFKLINKKDKVNKNDDIKFNVEFNQYEIWEMKYNPKMMIKWEDKSIFQIINDKINFRQWKRLRYFRNCIFVIMNEYYKNSITPSYINDSDLYEKDKKDEAEKIIGEYDYITQ